MYTGLDRVVGEKLEILFGLLSVVPYELLGTFYAIHTRIFSTGTFTDVVGTVSVVMVNIQLCIRLQKNVLTVLVSVTFMYENASLQYSPQILQLSFEHVAGNTGVHKKAKVSPGHNQLSELLSIRYLPSFRRSLPTHVQCTKG